MAKLDKSKKLDHITYFFFPKHFKRRFLALMHDSHEKEYTLHTHKEIKFKVPKDQQITTLQYYKEMPSFIDTEPMFCISKYDPQYLFEKMEEQGHDPIRIKTTREMSDRLRSYPDYQGNEDEDEY